MSLPRMRTIKEAIKEIKLEDPHSCMTEHALRRFILDGTIPSVRAGGKYLINIDKLNEYLSVSAEGSTCPGIRRVDARG